VFSSRLPGSWTAHEDPWPEFATSSPLPLRQGLPLVFLTTTKKRSDCFRRHQLPRKLIDSPERSYSTYSADGPLPHGRLATGTPHAPPLPPRHRTKPIKAPASSCGLVHCTVCSLSPRSTFASSPAFLRRETEQTFFSHTKPKFIFSSAYHTIHVPCAKFASLPQDLRTDIVCHNEIREGSFEPAGIRAKLPLPKRSFRLPASKLLLINISCSNFRNDRFVG
jgi:hypothetical protein